MGGGSGSGEGEVEAEAEPTVEMDDHAPVADTTPPEQPMEPPLPAPEVVADPPAVVEAPASNGVREEKYETGDWYRGMFQGELREGKGLYVYAEGPIKEFEGDFKAGWGHGLGRFKCAPCRRLLHSCVLVAVTQGRGGQKIGHRTLLSGRSTLCCSSASVPRRSHPLGLGGSGGRFSDGGHYEGEVAQGNMHGCGKLVMASGATYTGMFNAGLMGGRGVHVNTDGSCTYKGEWAEGKKSGRGMQSSANGDNYDGDWRDNLMHGQVCPREPALSQRTPAVCTAPWRIERRRGRLNASAAWRGLVQGTLRLANGDVYEGAFDKAKRCGHGVMTYKVAPGAVQPLRYVGGWRKDTYHGRGLLTRTDGTKEDAMWKDGHRRAAAGEHLWWDDVCFLCKHTLSPVRNILRVCLTRDV